MNAALVQPQRLPSRRRRLALALGAAFLLAAIAQIPLGLEADHRAAAGSAVLFVPFAAIGVLIAYRQPANAIGWIVLALALVCTASLDAGIYSVLANTLGDHLPLRRLAAVAAPFWLPLFVLLPLPVALFPDGQIPAGRWRLLFWLYVAVALAFVVWTLEVDLRAFSVRRLAVDRDGQLLALTSPNPTLQSLFVDAYVACVLGMVARQLVRFRASRGDERQQVKWLLAGGTVALVCFAAASWLPDAGPLVTGLVALPLGLGIGVLKYRLYEIDRLISRTLSYALLTAMLAGVFAAIVVLLTDVLPFSSPVGVAASTLAAAALFNPLRRRTQRLIDRRFNRSRYDADATVAAFTVRLRDAVEIDEIRTDLLDAVNRAVEPTRAWIWIKPHVHD